MSSATTISSFYGTIVHGEAYGAAPIQIVVAISLVFVSLFFFSRGGYSRLVAYVLTWVYLVGVIYTAASWGMELPQVAVTYALVIVISGILISSKYAFFITVFIGIITFVLISLEQNGFISPNYYWRSDPFSLSDTLIMFVTLGVVATVSWLSNREIEKALKRARGSEKALKKERDLLEVKVEERTDELKRTQLEKILHLYHLADFGRMTAGLFHDLVNPLTMVSLNLERLQARGLGEGKRGVKDTKKLVGRAVSGTKRMEGFVQAVKKQIQKQEVKTSFILCEEINQSINILDYKTKEMRVKVRFVHETKVRNFGNPIRFNQLVTNLVSNAIDSYQKVKRRKNRKIIVRVIKNKNIAILTVQDFGCGIAKGNLKKIFDPFFTTKSIEEGTGIGLSICKDIVEKEFGGKIKAESKQGKGTTFFVEFSLKKRSS